MITSGCRCWSYVSALGHNGHCCFLRDDRDRKANGGFKEDSEICHSAEVRE